MPEIISNLAPNERFNIVIKFAILLSLIEGLNSLLISLTFTDNEINHHYLSIQI
jgi:hypothetical protein